MMRVQTKDTRLKGGFSRVLSDLSDAGSLKCILKSDVESVMRCEMLGSRSRLVISLGGGSVKEEFFLNG